MQRISQKEFEASRDAYDLAVADTPDLLPFCSSSTWLLAGREALLGLGEEGADDGEPEQDLRLPEAAIRADTAIWRSEDLRDWMVFGRSPWGYWEPFEAAWMFGCPLVGPEPERLVQSLRDLVRRDPDLTSGFGIGGVAVGGRLHRCLRSRQEKQEWQQYREYPGVDCLSLHLSEGIESWLSRRSRKFRRSLRNAERDCRAEGLEVEFVVPEKGEERRVSEADALYARLLSVAAETSKWAEKSDIFQIERYRDFYHRIVVDLWRQDRLRLQFARREGKDVGYLLGGIFGSQFRGLQMGYARSVSSLGVGNWLQWESLCRRAEEGIDHYDLGMDSPYKQRWADETHGHAVVFLVP